MLGNFLPVTCSCKKKNKTKVPYLQIYKETDVKLQFAAIVMSQKRPRPVELPDTSSECAIEREEEEIDIDLLDDDMLYVFVPADNSAVEGVTDRMLLGEGDVAPIPGPAAHPVVNRVDGYRMDTLPHLDGIDRMSPVHHNPTERLVRSQSLDALPFLARRDRTDRLYYSEPVRA